jgi:hypothetical protein
MNQSKQINILAILVTIILTASCEEKKPVPITTTYSIDDGNRGLAISDGCYEGWLAACDCSVEEPITCSSVKCPREQDSLVYQALKKACRRDRYEKIFRYNDKKHNVRELIRESCEFYLRTHYIVVTGYSESKAKLQAMILCEYRLSKKRLKFE